MVARLGFAADEFEHRLASLRAVRVVPARPVIPRAGLERQRARAVVAPPPRALCAPQRRLDHLGLHVDEHRARDGRGATAFSGASFSDAPEPDPRRRACGVRKNASWISSRVDAEDASASRASVEKSSVPTWGTGVPRTGGFGSERPGRFRARVPTRGSGGGVAWRRGGGLRRGAHLVTALPKLHGHHRPRHRASRPPSRTGGSPARERSGRFKSHLALEVNRGRSGPRVKTTISVASSSLDAAPRHRDHGGKRVVRVLLRRVRRSGLETRRGRFRSVRGLRRHRQDRDPGRLLRSRG